MNFIEIKDLFFEKNIAERMKKQVTDWEKICKTHI